VRSTVVLPAGTGKVTRVLVFAVGDAERVAREAGADYTGSDDLIKQIQEGWLEFDATIAMADQMGKVGGLGRILGRRGLMPNPRSGTVVRSPDDLPAVIRELKGGRVEFRNDRTGLVHVAIGKKSFSEEQILQNLYALVDAINRVKPSAAKGVYCRSITLTSTMGPGIPLEVATTLSAASQAAAA
jgi:large subunit ribosomal protein L1